MAQKKITCIINGKILHLSEAAYKLAAENYGAKLAVENPLESPVELKQPLIKPPKILVAAEKPAEIKPEEPKQPEVKEEATELIKEIPKVKKSRAKKNG